MIRTGKKKSANNLMIRNFKVASILPWLAWAVILFAWPPCALCEDIVFQSAGEKVDRGELKFQADALQTMTPTPFTLTIDDGSGKAIGGANVSCRLTMPAMAMPENRPRVSWNGNLCRGVAIFTMAGAWRMSCRVVSSAGPETVLTFDIPEVRLK